MTSLDFDFEVCNHTELYQIARGAQLNPQPSMTRAELVQLIQGEIDTPKETNPIDFMRFGIAAFVDEHWEALQSQLDCPAKERHEKSCFKCVDAQVLKCVVINPGLSDFINRRR